ncbi:MAG: ACP S-malonyltransferase [Bacteriovoracaceae bacterium]|nr:ACP S-malonyltransferase [Bacteriovoracaceae bacterium]
MAKSVTLLFPGQGAQYVGMGKDLDQDLFRKADIALGFSLSRLMLEGPEEELKLTQNTQPAILSHSIALFKKVNKILTERGVKIDRVLGHSVGEYAALVAADVLSFEDAVKAVNLRGKFMQSAVPAGKGKMIAVMKVPEEKIIAACKAVSTENEKVMPANFNEPNQTVISGEANACDRAVAWLTENHTDPHRTIELQVSAPFHSSLMKPAALKLEKAFEEFTWKSNNLDYIANINARTYATGTNADTIKQNLIKQVDGSVLWTKSIQALPEDTLCLEVGPGRVLMGLVRKIKRGIKVIPLDKDGSFEDLMELL